MIASPSDVAEERDIIRSVINEWNYVNVAEKKIVLLPVGWETHSSPELSGRPQEIINKKVLKDCDLLIGVFWTRLGTPTGVEVSGTVEEIKEHSALGKPVMVYFSSKPVAPESFDSEQYDALKNFKDWCKKQGLIEVYDNLNEFKDKLTRQLQITINGNDYLKKVFSDEKENESLKIWSDIHKPRLTDDAITLLKEASKSENALITNLRFIGGAEISAGGKNFLETNSRRDIARWEDAVNNLGAFEMIKDINGKGQMFEVTKKGFDFIDGH